MVAPFSTADLEPLLNPGVSLADAPAGYAGAPLTAVLARELVQLGHEVLALTVDYQWRSRPNGAWTASGPGLTYRVLSGRSHAWRPSDGHCGRAWDGFAIERRRMVEVIQAWQPQVVHAHWTYEYALAGLASGLPTLVTAHDSPRRILSLSRSVYRAVRWLMARQVLQRAEWLTTVSPYMVGELRAQGARAVMVVPNPVARDFLRRARHRPRPDAHQIALVSNGWSRWKNVAAAIQAHALFRQGCPDSTLHLYGRDLEPDGPAARWAQAAGLADGLCFHGPLPHQALAQCLATHDALLHTALEESFGVVLAEAMALGMPVVAGDACGAVPWVTGASEDSPAGAAILTDVRSPAKVAEALRRLFDEQYGARSAAALDNVRRRFDPTAVAREYLQAYGQLVPSPAAR